MIAVVCILILAVLFFIISGFCMVERAVDSLRDLVHLPEKNGQNMMKRKCAGQWVFSVPSAA